ncbi:MAG: phosphoribosylformylglycinamidine synthase I [Candidatus Eremiobacteraeota bacterium]|nr:phosphoribosylformylglycinamidine synthase I [Candidatus Eremiobacteraeota bacterium]
MTARVAVLVYPGTNSEEETLRILHDVGVNAELVHWSRAETLGRYDAFVLPGGFAYEDRIRAGAVAAHDRLTDAVIEGAQGGKLVLGICNGAQMLLEAGLVPGTGEIRRPTAAFTKNAPLGKFVCKHVYVQLAIDPTRCAITAALEPKALIPAWAAHGEGRLAASEQHLAEIRAGNHIAFVYADNPNGSALDVAALTNREGNVLAIMPHPERDAWTFNHPMTQIGRAAFGNVAKALAPSGGSVLFESFARALQ